MAETMDPSAWFFDPGVLFVPTREGRRMLRLVLHDTGFFFVVGKCASTL